MALTKDQIVSTISSYVTDQANLVAGQEIAAYQKADPNALIEPEIRDLVTQRCVSELLFRSCNFKFPQDDGDEQALRDALESWYLIDEDSRLRQMCSTAIKEELKKRAKPGDENLTFTQKYLRMVREKSKTGSTVDLMNSLKDH